MQTVVKEKNQAEIIEFPFPYKMEEDNKLRIEVLGQTPERTIEDRAVYLSLKTFNSNKDKKTVSRTELNSSFWIDGEEAIELGEMLIRQGRFALNANRIQWQALWYKGRLEQYIREDRISKILIELIDENPVNFGEGFHTFNIKPIWKKYKAPEYLEDFNYDVVIYFSPFDNDFKKQMESLTGGVPYKFINYNYDEEVKKFKKECEELA